MSNSKKRQNSRSSSARRYRSQAKRVLKENAEQGRIGLDGLHAAQFQLLTLFSRIHRMHEFIDEAFAGNPFLPGVAGNAPLNQQRFNAYVSDHKQVTNLLKRALDLWMLACGMKAEDNWVPLFLENMRQAAAAKAMAVAAGHEE